MTAPFLSVELVTKYYEILKHLIKFYYFLPSFGKKVNNAMDEKVQNCNNKTIVDIDMMVI